MVISPATSHMSLLVYCDYKGSGLTGGGLFADLSCFFPQGRARPSPISCAWKVTSQYAITQHSSKSKDLANGMTHSVETLSARFL